RRLSTWRLLRRTFRFRFGTKVTGFAIGFEVRPACPNCTEKWRKGETGQMATAMPGIPTLLAQLRQAVTTRVITDIRFLVSWITLSTLVKVAVLPTVTFFTANCNCCT